MKLRARLGASLSLLLVFGCGPEPMDPESGAGGSSAAVGGASASGGQTSGGTGGTSVGGAAPPMSGGGPSSAGGSWSGGSSASGGGPGGSGGDESGGSSSSGGLNGSSGGGAESGGGSGGEGSACPFSGQISYTLARSGAPSADEEDAYARITAALDKALTIYNCYTDISQVLNAQYNPSVATADGNPNGSIRFGSRASMNFVTAMHEISHVLGVGADGAYDPLIVNGVYTGPIATARLRELTQDDTAEIHGDSQHFWPYGLNYESEYHSEEDGIFHCFLVTAIRQDIGWD